MPIDPLQREINELRRLYGPHLGRSQDEFDHVQDCTHLLEDMREDYNYIKLNRSSRDGNIDIGDTVRQFLAKAKLYNES